MYCINYSNARKLHGRGLGVGVLDLVHLVTVHHQEARKQDEVALHTAPALLEVGVVLENPEGHPHPSGQPHNNLLMLIRMGSLRVQNSTKANHHHHHLRNGQRVKVHRLQVHLVHHLVHHLNLMTIRLMYSCINIVKEWHAMPCII